MNTSRKRTRDDLSPDLAAKFEDWVDAKRRRDFSLADRLRQEMRERGVEPEGRGGQGLRARFSGSGGGGGDGGQSSSGGANSSRWQRGEDQDRLEGGSQFNWGAHNHKGAGPRLNERQLNGLFSRQPKEELATLFLEFVRFDGFINEMHVSPCPFHLLQGGWQGAGEGGPSAIP